MKAVLLGQRAIGPNDEFLSALVSTGSTSVAIHEEFHFNSLLKDAADYHQLTIVGNRYRNSEQQKVLANKSARTLVLLMREPGNPVDSNAIACLMTKQLNPDDSRSGFTWVHVGYLPKNVAEGLAGIWPVRNGLPMLVHATLRESKAMRIRNGVVYLDPVAEEYSTTVRARDLSMYL